VSIDFYRGSADGLIENETRQLTLVDGTCYWFLHRYFEAANVDRSRELIDLYRSATLAGYQLDLLEHELKIALVDVANTEIRKPLEKREAVETIEQLLELIQKARDSNTYLAYQGN
jgi:hypothetical protein